MKYFVFADVHGFYSILKEELVKQVANNKDDSSVADGEVDGEYQQNPPVLEEEQSPSVADDESTEENQPSDEIVVDDNVQKNDVEYMEKGQYRMKYIANTDELDTNEYFIYITLE